MLPSETSHFLVGRGPEISEETMLLLEMYLYLEDQELVHEIFEEMMLPFEMCHSQEGLELLDLDLEIFEKRRLCSEMFQLNHQWAEKRRLCLEMSQWVHQWDASFPLTWAWEWECPQWMPDQDFQEDQRSLFGGMSIHHSFVILVKWRCQ